MFYQVRVPTAGGAITDRGVLRVDGEDAVSALTRVKTDAPGRGHYYCAERKGLYIFNALDREADLQIEYTDHASPKYGALKTHVAEGIKARAKAAG